MHFVVRWPDNSVEACYSPSLVVREHFEVGESYVLDDFVARSRTALMLASDRVREQYGFACTHALAQLAAIEARARSFPPEPPNPEAALRVVVVAFEPA